MTGPTQFALGRLRLVLAVCLAGGLLTTVAAEAKAQTLAINCPTDSLPSVRRRLNSTGGEYDLAKRLELRACKVNLTPGKAAKISVQIRSADRSGLFTGANHPHPSTAARPHGWIWAGAAAPADVYSADGRELVAAYKAPGGDTSPTRVITLTTSASGEASFTYLAPEIAGYDILTAKWIDGTTVRATVNRTIAVRTPDLRPAASYFDEELLPYVSFVGATTRHPDNHAVGACGSHWATDDLAVRLSEATRTYAELQLNDRFLIKWGANTPSSLKINDISLPLGGLFDLDGDWAPPHGGHRDGVNADIRTIDLVTTDPTKASIGSAVGNQKVSYQRLHLLMQALSEQGFTFISEGNTSPHLHLSVQKPTAPMSPLVFAQCTDGVTIRLNFFSLPIPGLLPASQFEIERRTLSSPFSRVATVPGSSKTWIDTKVVPHQIYFYRMRATNGSIKSSFSYDGLGTFLPTAPVGVTATMTSPSDVLVQWVDTSGVDVANFCSPDAFVGYEVEITDLFGNRDVVSAFEPFLAEDRLAAETGYSFRVRTSVAGIFATSAWSAPCQLITPPHAPAAVGGSASGPNTIQLQWFDVSQAEEGVQIERAATSSGPWQRVATLPTDSTRFVDNSVASGRTYWYRLRNVNQYGFSYYAGAIPVTTPLR